MSNLSQQNESDVVNQTQNLIKISYDRIVFAVGMTFNQIANAYILEGDDY